MDSDVKIGILVFARMNSRRLPGKALLPVGQRPLLGHVVDRAARVRRASGVVLATSADPSDDPLEDFARSEGVLCCRGPLDDLVRRAAACARGQGWTAFARVCGDRVFFEPAYIDCAIARMNDEAPGSVDLVTNTLTGPVAPGLTTEVIAASAMEKVLELTCEREYLEHVTSYIYAFPEQFKIVSIDAPPPSTMGLRFVVDTTHDLQRGNCGPGALSGSQQGVGAGTGGAARCLSRV